MPASILYCDVLVNACTHGLTQACTCGCACLCLCLQDALLFPEEPLVG